MEGLALHYGVRYGKRIDTVFNRDFAYYANVRYGFSNKRLNGYAGASFPWGKSTFGLYGGSNVQDLNNRGALLPLSTPLVRLFSAAIT